MAFLTSKSIFILTN